MDWFGVFAGILLIVSASGQASWRWECDKGFCQKRRTTDENRDVSLSLSACRLFCSNYANLWPRPNGKMTIGNFLARLNVNSIDVLGPSGDTPINDRVRKAAARFKDIIDKKELYGNRTSGGKSLEVKLQISNPEILRLALDLDESYTLNVAETKDGRIHAIITANNYFGARHGLETLAQLIIYDDIRDEFQIVRDVHIEDKPVYTYRGILLDTARNYISVDNIKKVLEGMALSKLNTFHWHITDSHSFPYVSKSRPILSKLGAYSPRKVYTPEMVADIVEYGLVRGIRVLPEFDAPAHVGEGWQDTGFVTCFNKQPWYQYCVEPPCGQLDPTQEGLYDYLEGIYQDMIDQFNPDIFHMGGDEVSLGCWNSTPSIVSWMEETKGWGTEEEDFMKLWDVFQSKALERYNKISGKEVPIIMWTSTLTKPEYIKQYLPNDKYIIQIWTTGTDDHVKELLDKNYRVIFSNYDALYFDCGSAGWVTDGQNWCSPYIGWQKVYGNSPKVLAGDKVKLVLGAEAALWTEQVDDSSVDAKLWPRAAAMAERLWAEPQESWRAAEQRMLVHRERLMKRGILAESLEPEWCMQNENNCPTNPV
ncbi:beta-hexosaminidase [Holotrichia oblita]|uniref:Beta-hexosaminidase n=1 Tax=Holotrichia oblita TaxID=644536 RepID=A0ACB9TQL1_HOLOL|nr:beta-hexosaminidase [Holotrichia oblita]